MSEAIKKAIDAKYEAKEAKAEAEAYQNKSRRIEPVIMVNRIVHERDGQGYKLLEEQKYSEAADFFRHIIDKYKEEGLDTGMTKMANEFVEIADSYFREEVVNKIKFYMDAIQFYRLALITRNNKSRDKFMYDGGQAEKEGFSLFRSKQYDGAYNFYKLATDHYKKASALYQTSKDSGSSPGLEKQGGYK